MLVFWCTICKGFSNVEFNIMYFQLGLRGLKSSCQLVYFDSQNSSTLEVHLILVIVQLRLLIDAIVLASALKSFIQIFTLVVPKYKGIILSVTLTHDCGSGWNQPLCCAIFIFHVSQRSTALVKLVSIWYCPQRLVLPLFLAFSLLGGLYKFFHRYQIFQAWSWFLIRFGWANARLRLQQASSFPGLLEPLNNSAQRSLQTNRTVRTE